MAGLWIWEGKQGRRLSVRQAGRQAELQFTRAPAKCPAPAMARYGAAAYMLADELEYLQAYEDVLEKYKGK